MKTEPAVPADALAAIRAPITAAGAAPVDAPILQPLSLLLELAGEAMRARLFVVQAEGGEEACLRPDFTVAVVRRHLELGAASGRYAYEGPAFRAARGDEPDEFLQLGLESFSREGGDPAAADAEIAGIAWRASLAGGRKDLSLWLGDVGLLAPFIRSLALPEALAAKLIRVAGRPRLLQAELGRTGEAARPSEHSELAALLSGLSEPQAASMLEEVWALAGVEPVGGRGAAEIAQRLVRRAQAAEAPALTEGQAAALRGFMGISDTPEAALNQMRSLAGSAAVDLDAAIGGWRRRLEILAEATQGAVVRFAPALGHAFDYYDGLTFEVRSEALGADRPVAVGGRYDGLLARLGGAGSAQAVGCMVRPWRAFVGGEA